MNLKRISLWLELYLVNPDVLVWKRRREWMFSLSMLTNINVPQLPSLGKKRANRYYLLLLFRLSFPQDVFAWALPSVELTYFNLFTWVTTRTWPLWIEKVVKRTGRWQSLPLSFIQTHSESWPLYCHLRWLASRDKLSSFRFALKTMLSFWILIPRRSHTILTALPCSFFQFVFVRLITAKHYPAVHFGRVQCPVRQTNESDACKTLFSLDHKPVVLVIIFQEGM